MKRLANIGFSVLLLVLTIVGTSGISVEKCSCTGRLTLTLQNGEGCCSGKSGCMETIELQLSDYMPTALAAIDVPIQPLLYPVYFTNNHEAFVAIEGRLLDSRCDKDPPGTLAHSVAVLRV